MAVGSSPNPVDARWIPAGKPGLIVGGQTANRRCDVIGRRALPDKYVMVAGDVGLAYALDNIERRSPAFREMAVRYGRPLKATMQ